MFFIYPEHVEHRHHDNDGNKEQIVRGRRPEHGLHPDHPGTAKDRTDCESPVKPREKGLKTEFSRCFPGMSACEHRARSHGHTGAGLANVSS